VAAEQPVLLSVRPHFAAALIDGTKTVEMRRRRMRLHDGTLCLLYASSPTRALTGALRVASVDHGTLDELWRRHGPRTALTRDEYDDYLDGRSTACALLVAEVIAFHTPVPLAELRRRSDAFVAPQSYRFVDDGELNTLLNGQAAELTALTAHRRDASSRQRNER
jgi:predicted transcriptional regulator